MKIPRRALAAAALPLAARAQARPIRLIVPFPPGGASDLLGRLMAERMGASLNTNVVVENRAGAGGLVAAEYAARQPADGTTLFQGTQATQVFNKFLYARLGYDPDRDFTPLGTIAAVAYILVVPAALPVNTVPELIAYARARPGQLNYGSSGMGSGMHLATHIFAELAGGNMTHVPYRGAAPAVTALVAGEIQLMVDLVPNSLALVRSGQLKALAVSTPRRLPQLPDVATFNEVGIDAFDVPSWFIMVASGQLPEPLAERLAAACDAAVGDPSFAERLSGVGAEPLRMSRAETRAFLIRESTRWEAIVRGANVRLD